MNSSYMNIDLLNTQQEHVTVKSPTEDNEKSQGSFKEWNRVQNDTTGIHGW